MTRPSRAIELHSTTFLPRSRRRASHYISHKLKPDNGSWRSPACTLSSVVTLLVLLWTFWSKGLYNLASSEQPVNADWQKASLKMRFISEGMSNLPLTMPNAMQSMAPLSASLQQGEARELKLIQSTSSPDLPLWEALLELPIPGGSADESAKSSAASNAQNAPGREHAQTQLVDPYSASDTDTNASIALPQLHPSAAVQADNNTAAGADALHNTSQPHGSQVSHLRLEALVNYTQEQLQALSNPGGHINGTVAAANEDGQLAGGASSSAAEAPLLTVAASQLETLSTAEVVAEPAINAAVPEVNQADHPGDVLGATLQDATDTEASQSISLGKDTAVESRSSQPRVHSLPESTSSTGLSSGATPQDVQQRSQVDLDPHLHAMSQVSEDHPVLQRVREEAEAQHGANGSQIVHHLMQALHLSGHLHNTEAVEHSTLLSTLSHLLHHPTQESLDSQEELPLEASDGDTSQTTMAVPEDKDDIDGVLAQHGRAKALDVKLELPSLPPPSPALNQSDEADLANATAMAYQASRRRHDEAIDAASTLVTSRAGTIKVEDVPLEEEATLAGEMQGNPGQAAPSGQAHLQEEAASPHEHKYRDRVQALHMQEGFSGGMLHETTFSDPEIDEGLGLWLPQPIDDLEVTGFDF